MIFSKKVFPASTINMKNLVKILALAVLCVLVCAACGGKNTDILEEYGDTIMVEITMENGGVIQLELYPEIAPITCANFVKLANDGFYDGLIFHRVIENFMIQGGDPTGTGMGGSDENIKGEFSANGVANPLSHERGVISMARSQKYDSASSQFFICHADAKYLDGQYAAFGKVIEGMDVVDAIAETATDRSDRPLEEQKMKTVRVVEE